MPQVPDSYTSEDCLDDKYMHKIPSDEDFKPQSRSKQFAVSPSTPACHGLLLFDVHLIMKITLLLLFLMSLFMLQVLKGVTQISSTFLVSIPRPNGEDSQSPSGKSSPETPQSELWKSSSLPLILGDGYPKMQTESP